MTREVPLTQGLVALVDDEDFDALAGFRWQASRRHSGRYYAQRASTVEEVAAGASSCVTMHRQIMAAKPGQMVDHINRDTLDNRRVNMRFATNAQNCANAVRGANKLGYRGVYASRNKFRASISVNLRVFHTTTYPDPVSAAMAYDALAKQHHGEFAILNFPDRP